MTVIFYNKNKFQPEFLENDLHLLYVCHADQKQNELPSLFHAHDTHLELQYISQGGGSMRIGSHLYEVSAGDLLVYNSGVIHDECADPVRGMWFYNCGIQGLHIEGLPENHLIAAETSPVLHTGSFAPHIQGLFETLRDQLANNRDGGVAVCQYLMSALLVILLRQVEHEPKMKLNKRDKLFIQVKDYIDQHYAEDFTMDELSRQAHMSTSNLTHQFKKRTGFSPVQYIIRRRIGRAQSLLISSDMSITDVSAEAGYDNLSYFNNQFKKIVGMSPQVYRKYRVGDNQYKRLNQICELWQKK